MLLVGSVDLTTDLGGVLNIRSIARAAALAAWSAGCSNSTGPSYNPQLPAAWANAVTNPYFPLTPGTTYGFSGQTTAGLETVTVDVLTTPQVVNGVTAVAVHDRVYLAGALIEDTYDWYAQDAAGNVWYLGEDAKEILNGQVVSTEGSWKWGVNGALPGVIMWSDPAVHLGTAYRQEYAQGQAEDFGKVLSLSQSVVVPFGSFTGCIITEDWTALDATQPHENKTYCPVVGLVRSVDIGGPTSELVSRTP